MEKTAERKAPPLPKGPTIEAVHLFVSTDRMHRRAIEGALSALGIHRSQHRLLLHLERTGGTASQRELADFLDISPAAVTVTVKKLEKNGCLRRTVSKKDSRRKELLLTERGREILHRSYQAFSEVDKIMMAGIEEAEERKMIELFLRMQSNLSTLLPEREEIARPKEENNE